MAEPQNTQDAQKLDQLSFEDALNQLETIVSQLEQGDVPLE
ncbi:MAG: exodeoxyribonuclease VII small subunit, partial [Pseudomonadota bacterium]